MTHTIIIISILMDVFMDIIVDIIMDIFTNRLHKDVIGPGLRENLYKPELMMEMFESQAEKIKTVYTKYLGDHMKVKAILKNDSMRIFIHIQVSHIVRTHSVYFKTLAKHVNLKVCLDDSLLNVFNISRFRGF